MGEAVLVEEDQDHFRRKTDRYNRPSDDHDLLTQLWTMFIHSCEEEAERHRQNVSSVAQLRTELAQSRSAMNVQVENLRTDFETRFNVFKSELDTIKTRDERQIGAWQLAKILAAVVAATFAAGGAGATIATLLLRAGGH